MFETNITSIGEATVIEVAGHLDSLNAKQFQSAIEEVLATGQENIILDLSEVNYISAAGLRVMNRLQQVEGVGDVRLVKPSRRVREVLQITGLDVVYQVYNSLGDVMHTIRPITNAHTHLELGWLSHQRPDVTGMDFMEWIREVVIGGWERLGRHSESAVKRSIHAGIEAMIEAGTTVVGDISLTGLSIEPLLQSGLHGVVYVELLGGTSDSARNQEIMNGVREKIETWRPRETSKMRVGLTIHTPYSVHPELMEWGLEYAYDNKLPLCIHVSETADEEQYLRTGEGRLKDVYFAGQEALPYPRKSGVAYLHEIGALDLQPLLIHAVHVSDDDIRMIAESGSAVVHCPRSNIRLRSGRMPVEKFVAANVPVLLGTDSLASSPSLNVLDELEVAVALHHDTVSAETLNDMVHRTKPLI